MTGRTCFLRRSGSAVARVLGAALAAAALVPPDSHAATHPYADWDGSLRSEAFHVNDLFPGGRREKDNAVRFDLRPALDLRAGPKLRLKPWGRVIAERYQTRASRDLERWSGGLDFKRGPHRLRIYSGWTPVELYFPSRSGDARLDRMIVGAALRVGLRPGWQAQVEAERERDDFNPLFDERDATRWTLHSGLERAFTADRSLALTHLYRRNDSITDLYTYDQNALRGTLNWDLSGWNLESEAEGILRNYRTPHAYDRNAARQDRRWRFTSSLGHRIAPHVSADVHGEYRINDSTRPGKNYDVTSVGVAMEITR